jgi:hypothetical protein
MLIHRVRWTWWVTQAVPECQRDGEFASPMFPTKAESGRQMTARVSQLLKSSE